MLSRFYSKYCYGIVFLRKPYEFSPSVGFQVTVSFQRSNAKLSTEVQELKDKMYKLQNERKVEVNELSDKLRTLKVENNVMKEEVKENKAKVAKMEVAYKEGLKRDEELKKAKDTLVMAFS